MRDGFWNLKKITHWLLCLSLFLLPWQTRLVYQPAFLNGGFWEYGSLSWYITEMLLWVIIILSAIDLFRQKELWSRIKAGRGSKRNLAIGLLVIGYWLFEIFHSLNTDISFQFVFRLLGVVCLAVILSREAHIFPAWAGKASRPGVGEAVEVFATQLPHPPLPRPSGELLALWLGGVLQGIIALWQFFSQTVIHLPFSGIAPHLPQDLGAFVIEFGDERWLRAYGAFGSPNILGGFLAIILLVGFILYIKTEPGPKKILLTVGQLFVTAGLILSFSRAAWVAVAVGIASLFFFSHSSGYSWKILLRPVIYSLAIVVVCIIVLQPLFLVRTRAVGRLEQQSITTRTEQFKDFKKIFYQHPFIGVGPGAYTLALHQNNPKLPVWRYQPIHNIYLLILAELGLIGFAGVVLLCCSAVVLTWRRNRFFLPIVILLFILGLFDHWLWSMYLGIMVWGATFAFSTTDT